MMMHVSRLRRRLEEISEILEISEIWEIWEIWEISEISNGRCFLRRRRGDLAFQFPSARMPCAALPSSCRPCADPGVGRRGDGDDDDDDEDEEEKEEEDDHGCDA